MAQSPPVVLSIAGFDPSSGAGVTADVKTIAAHGCYGVSCITALTVQSTAGVRRVEAISADLVSETLEELSSDIAIAAVHIGMLGSGKVARVVSDFLAKAGLPNIVLDPIMKSSSGADLIVDINGVNQSFLVQASDGSNRIVPSQYWVGAANSGDKLLVTYWVG